MNPRGKTDLSTLFWVVVVAAAIYAGVIFIPVYADHFDVKEAVNAAYNAAGKENDAGLRAKMQFMLRNTGTHKETDDFNYTVVKPGLGLTDDQIVIERNDVARTVLIAVDYARDVQLKPTQQVVKLHFSEKKEGPIVQ